MLSLLLIDVVVSDCRQLSAKESLKLLRRMVNVPRVALLWM